MAAQAERGLTVRDNRTISDPREEEQLTRSLILKNATDAQLKLVLGICDRYGFDPLLKHVVIVSNNLYVTRDGLLHLAHASGQFDGIGVEMSQARDGEWVATCTVHRKDMTHPIVYTAFESEHKPANPGGSAWGKYPRAMLQKCAEVMALRRAFDVSVGAAEEIGYDGITPQTSAGRVTVIEAAPHEAAVMRVTDTAGDGYAGIHNREAAPLAAQRGKSVPPQPAPPPLPAQPLDAAAFNAGVDAFLEQAEAGLTLGELRKLITDWDRELGQEQRAEIRAHWAAIKEHRAQERATRLAPDATAQQIIEAEVRVAPQPTPAAALAASDDPFGDQVLPVSYAG